MICYGAGRVCSEALSFANGTGRVCSEASCFCMRCWSHLGARARASSYIMCPHASVPTCNYVALPYLCASVPLRDYVPMFFRLACTTTSLRSCTRAACRHTVFYDGTAAGARAHTIAIIRNYYDGAAADARVHTIATIRKCVVARAQATATICKYAGARAHTIATIRTYAEITVLS